MKAKTTLPKHMQPKGNHPNDRPNKLAPSAIGNQIPHFNSQGAKGISHDGDQPRATLFVPVKMRKQLAGVDMTHPKY